MLRLKLSEVLPLMNEKQRRVVAASEAKWYGRGGVSVVARVTGMCRQTIYNGLASIAAGDSSQRIRKPGGGRKKLREQEPEIVKKIEDLIDDVTRGDPESPLRWTSKSVRKVAESLMEEGINEFSLKLLGNNSPASSQNYVPTSSGLVCGLRRVQFGHELTSLTFRKFRPH